MSMRSGWAAAMPRRDSETTSSTWLISFFIAWPPPVGCSLLLPVPRPLDRLLPLGLPDLPLFVAPAGLPRAVDLPVLAQLVEAVPEADGQAGRVRGAECGRLADRGPHHRRAQDVGLELHQEVVLDHAAVDLQRLDLDAGILLHR